jgi:anti-sigma regulatory factor (Ser/Thr protein kinase)
VAADDALLKLDLPDRTEAPSAARKALTALNGSLHLISAERLRDAQLLVSELVANAVRHGGQPGVAVSVTVRASPETMRVEVTDRGTGFDPVQLAVPSRERSGGWGCRSWPRSRTAGASNTTPTPPSGSRSTDRNATRRSSRTDHRHSRPSF